MGLFNWVHNKHMTDPVDGSLQLTSCSAGANDAAYSNCRMQGVVSAPGLAPTAVEHLCTAPIKKWPQPGQSLPVRVDRADPTRLQVRWDDLPTNRELGRQFARQQAEWLASSQQAQEQQQAQPGERTQTWSTPPNAPQVNVRVRIRSEPDGGQPEVEVAGAPGRALPGTAGGGFTPQQASAAVSGNHAGLQPATATVLAVYDVPVPPGMPGGGPAGVADLTLDVHLPGGDRYSTTMRISFSTPDKRARVAAPGVTLPVLVNRAARDQIVIDTTRLI